MRNKNFFKPEALRFKRFSRKGYALFACLGKVVVVGVLSVATIQKSKAAESGSAGSDGERQTLRLDGDSIADGREYELSEIEVAGDRSVLPSVGLTRMVTVLRAEDIQSAAVQSVNDLLKLCAGVDVRQRAPLGAQTDVSIRGGTSEHIAILLNGICVSDPQTGHNSLDLPVQLSDIQRIEIIEGPAARVYGAQSLLGAVNIVTAPLIPPFRGDAPADKGNQNPPPIRGRVGVGLGSFGYLSANAGVNIPFGSLSASYSRADGFSRSQNGSLNGDYEGNKFFYQGQYGFSRQNKKSEGASLRWSFGIAQKRWGSSTSYGIGSDSQYERTDKYFANIAADIPFAVGGALSAVSLKPAVYWQQNNDRYSWKRGISVPNANTTNIYGGRLRGVMEWGRKAPLVPPLRGDEPADESNQNLLPLRGEVGWGLQTKVGVELRSENLGSSNMPNTSRTNLSLHLDQTFSYSRFRLSAGLMAIRNSFNNMPMRVYPGVEASCYAGRGWTVYASWNRSMRLPSFTELYYKVDGHLADPNLRAEEMDAINVGAKYSYFFGQSSLSLCRHKGKDMIDWIIDTRLGADAVWTSVNHAQISSYGAEIQNRWQLSRLFPSQKVLQTFTLGYNYMYQKQLAQEHIQSLYALEYLRHKVVASLTLRFWKIDLSLSYRFQDRVGSYTDVSGARCDYRPYSVFDARIDAHVHRRVDVHLTLNNIFSARYVDYGNVRQPGIWVMGGADVKW